MEHKAQSGKVEQAEWDVAASTPSESVLADLVYFNQCAKHLTGVFVKLDELFDRSRDLDLNPDALLGEFDKVWLLFSWQAKMLKDFTKTGRLESRNVLERLQRLAQCVATTRLLEVHAPLMEKAPESCRPSCTALVRWQLKMITTFVETEKAPKQVDLEEVD